MGFKVQGLGFKGSGLGFKAGSLLHSCQVSAKEVFVRPARHSGSL